MNPILSVQDLSISLSGKEEKLLTHKVSFDVYPGEIFALVGESGSGKSISSLATLGIYPQPNGFRKEGCIQFLESELTGYSEKQWQEVRGREMAMIFQEPAAALNPLQKIGVQLKECLELHPHSEPFEIVSLLKRVGFEDPERVLNAWPHELSGGMQQRVMIAMALIHKPKLLIADEPTTALDVTIQAQIMELLLDLQEEMQMAILFITHNLALVAQYADRLAVMSQGRIVETNDVIDFFQNPIHEYSKELIDAVPGKRKL